MLEKRICIFCNKEYFVDTSLGNWTKDNHQSLEKPSSLVSSKKYCCYSCGKEHRKLNMEKKCLEKYGVKNIAQLESTRKKYKETCLKKYGVENVFQVDNIKLKLKQTNLKRYGVDLYSKTQECREKIKDTCINKYGKDSFFKTDEWKEKVKQTSLKNWGVDSPNKSEIVKAKIQKSILKKYGTSSYLNSKENREYLNKHKNELKQKEYNTKKSNNSFVNSKAEDYVFELLCTKYSKVLRYYRSDLYPYNCDFYIPELDLYIEYNGNWTHGNKPYEDSVEDKAVVKLWKQKASEVNFKGIPKNYYLQAIYVWTKLDIEKRKIAKKNKLNFIEFWNIKQVKKWLNN